MTHQKAFEEFAKEAKRILGDSLKKLILYGSMARGEETEESDVDVFAVVETKEQKDKLERMGAEIGVENGVLIVPIVKTIEEFDEMKDSLYGEEVLLKGKFYA